MTHSIVEIVTVTDPALSMYHHHLQKSDFTEKAMHYSIKYSQSAIQ